jgi:hypothetical protein
MIGKNQNLRPYMTPAIVAGCLVVLFVAIIGILFQLARYESSLRSSAGTPRGEQLAVYRALIADQIGHGKGKIHLLVQTEPLAIFEPDDRNCEQELKLEPVPSAPINRFQSEDLDYLGSERIALLDPETLSETVVGKSFKADLSRGLPADVSLLRKVLGPPVLTLSAIRFEDGHQHAIAAYAFVCDGDCGRGEIAVLEKRDGQWKRKQECIQWVM